VPVQKSDPAFRGAVIPVNALDPGRADTRGIAERNPLRAVD
jgi:hypothetical protein